MIDSLSGRERAHGPWDPKRGTPHGTHYRLHFLDQISYVTLPPQLDTRRGQLIASRYVVGDEPHGSGGRTVVSRAAIGADGVA